MIRKIGDDELLTNEQMDSFDDEIEDYNNELSYLEKHDLQEQFYYKENEYE